MHHDVAIARGCRAIPYYFTDDGRSMEKIANLSSPEKMARQDPGCHSVLLPTQIIFHVDYVAAAHSNADEQTLCLSLPPVSGGLSLAGPLSSTLPLPLATMVACRRHVVVDDAA